MAERVIVTLHLPLDMGAVSRILKAIAVDYPDATIRENATVIADPDIPLSARQAKVAARRRAIRP